MSQTSHQEDSPDVTSSGDSLENFCKKVLKSRIFLGEFKEKRLVPSLGSYRDVVVVDVQSECAIANDMDIVCGKLASEHGEKDCHWIGLTRNSNQSVLVWTELESFYTFGKYWFQIKTVRFRTNEILLKLKVLRSADEPPPRTLEELPFKWDDLDWPLFERMGQDVCVWGKQQLRNFLVFLFSLRIHPKQIISCINMTVFGVMFAVVSAFQAVQWIGNFALRFMREITRCINVLTPIFLGTLDVFSKIVGGFYMLIAMIWRDSINLKVANRANRNNFPALTAPPRRFAPRRPIRN